MGSGLCDMCNLPAKIEPTTFEDLDGYPLGTIYLCYECMNKLRELAEKPNHLRRIRISIDYYVDYPKLRKVSK